MYFYQEADTGNWVLGEHHHNTVPAGSCRLVTGNSTSSLKIKTIASGEVLANGLTNVAGMTYNWTLPANWVKTAGGTTNEITVTVGGVDDDGDISVTATNDYGTSIARTLTVSVEEGS